ncbi:WxL domain-containing protein [Vagococcus sp. BWB3-3]|uniref:WxL domain-containing protein n=1 Tax=Vagococcus allomyrinae TaxID=2794353 RepID=A0A940ST91_9ENTE|nr:WxL domain-containing protein [Vagococcus allomyrinae]MBP1039419.1 WxL domain-containing protein [Vagococcus allomyrinae]
MKKTVSGMMFCGALLMVGTTALADDATTTGTVKFTTSTDKDGQIAKPEVPGEIIEPEGGKQTSGDLRIQFVPDFNFGTNEIEVGQQVFNPILQKYTFEDAAKPGDHYMPQFIQVTDVRGKKQGWKLTVSASTFKTTEVAGAYDELPYAKISLKQAKLSNDVYDTTEISSKVRTFGDTGVLEIPTDAGQSKLVMQTKTDDAASTTDGSRTSIVLDNGYDKTRDYLATDKNQQVTLTKTNKDIPVVGDSGQAKEYTSIITWTLTDGI